MTKSNPGLEKPLTLAFGAVKTLRGVATLLVVSGIDVQVQAVALKPVSSNRTMPTGRHSAKPLASARFLGARGGLLQTPCKAKVSKNLGRGRRETAGRGTHLEMLPSR